MTFDLKGSTYKRKVLFSEKEDRWWIKGEKKGHRKCMVDKNFM